MFSSTMWLQAVEWDAAACFVAFQGCMLIVVGLMLFVPSALGKKDGWYNAYYQKNAVLYERVSEEADILRGLEIEIGTHVLVWGISTVAVLMAGGGAQIICILELAPMLALMFYFFKVKETFYAAVSFFCFCLFSYFGFFPTPMVPSIEWQAAGMYTTFHSALLLLFAVIILSGKTENLYKENPAARMMMSVREREILVGVTLLGVAAASMGATITNVASNFCLLAAPGPLVSGIGHWLSTGDKNGAITNWVFMLIFLCFGLFPRVMQ